MSVSISTFRAQMLAGSTEASAFCRSRDRLDSKHDMVDIRVAESQNGILLVLEEDGKETIPYKKRSPDEMFTETGTDGSIRVSARTIHSIEVTLIGRGGLPLLPAVTVAVSDNGSISGKLLL